MLGQGIDKLRGEFIDIVTAIWQTTGEEVVNVE
jgi:hypothetical protein